MAQQPDLFPVTDEALHDATFRLIGWLAAVDEEKANMKLVREQHKATLEELNEKIADERAEIARAKMQRERGLTPGEASAVLRRAVEDFPEGDTEEEEAHG